MDNSFLGIENAVNSATTFRRNYTTPTPSQQTGYEATYLRDQHLGKRWRGATADVRYTPLLARFDDVYRVGASGGLGHNLSPSATWRATLGTTGVRPAVRPAWVADGVDDYGISGETLATTTDLSLLAYLYVPPPGASHESGGATPAILELKNAASGIRMRLSIRTADATGVEFFLDALTFNFDGVSFTAARSLSRLEFGRRYLIGYRYRASDDRCELWLDGVFQSFSTATRTVTGTEGDVSIEISRGGAGAVFTPARWRDIGLWDSYLSDAKMAADAPEILDGDERGLVDGIQFTEGTGGSAVSVKGTTTIALTGGLWANLANPSPVYTTGVLEAIGQWYRRQALRIATGTSFIGPSLGTATRDVTLSFLLDLPDDFISDTDEEILIYGSSTANAEISFSLDSSGRIVLTSNRGTPDSVTSASVRGLGVVRVRAILESIDNTQSDLSLYLGTGADAESLVGTVQVGPYDAAASCLIAAGDANLGSANSHARISDVRLFGAVRLESGTAITDNLLSPCNLSDPSLIESIRLDGDVESDADDSRSYTTASVTYESIDNPNVTRPAPGREGLGYPYTSGRGQIEAELLDFVANADVEVSEIFLEIWDRKNADGYVSLGTLCCWATFRPDENRVTGSERTWKMRKAMRTDVGGIPYLEDAYEAPVGKISLKYLDIIDEQDEVYRRVLRARRDKLVLLATEPRRLEGQTKTATPQHLFVDYFVAGTLTPTTETIKEGNERHVEIDLEVEGVRRQTA
jgi:hypothetical protein